MEASCGASKEILMGGDEENNKITWMDWDVMCKSKDLGGLGIKNLKVFNEVLLAKWKWNLFHQRGNLWGDDVLASKYKGWQGLGYEGVFVVEGP